ncbi:MAG: HK97 family phage prohead protease [Parcubacteria group bacterium]
MTEEIEIEGYASLFWTRDLNDDVTAAGAFAASLARSGAAGVKMLFQHEAGEPVGVWDEIAEDSRGLFVRGRILTVTPQGRLVAALVKAGALDGLSIGFRTVKARPDESGRLRVLTEVELWEVSIVTFPMLPQARIETVKANPAIAA